MQLLKVHQRPEQQACIDDNFKFEEHKTVLRSYKEPYHGWLGCVADLLEKDSQFADLWLWLITLMGHKFKISRNKKELSDCFCFDFWSEGIIESFPC